MNRGLVWLTDAQFEGIYLIKRPRTTRHRMTRSEGLTHKIVGSARGP